MKEKTSKVKYLDEKGLSMSQAQSVSNLCHQRASEIERKLNEVNNGKKSVKIRKDTVVQRKAVKMPENVIELLKEKGKLHACQAFLMEAVKEKEIMMTLAKTERFEYSGPLEMPVRPNYESEDFLPEVNEDWGWAQLSPGELSEYLENEALAAHIGQFIHSGGKLDTLRRDIRKDKGIEWVSDGDRQYPVITEEHHTPEDLHKLHESLALEHRGYEQRVNYFKAKVKNLVAAENARRHKHNSDESARVDKINTQLEQDYSLAVRNYKAAVDVERSTFEAEREEFVNKLSAFRIKVNPRFQDVIDIFMKDLGE